MKEFAKWFYKSKVWRQCRDAYFISIHGICERCGNAGKIVHHKILLNPDNINDPDISLNFEHLELLCQDCHNKEHHGSNDKVLRDGLMFDSDGNVVQSPLLK